MALSNTPILVMPDLSFINLDEGREVLGAALIGILSAFLKSFPPGVIASRSEVTLGQLQMVIITSVLWAWTLLMDQCPGLRWVQKTPLHLGGLVNLHART